MFRCILIEIIITSIFYKTFFTLTILSSKNKNLC
nr:MAG TPA: hypothetical protein [Caudoviricetes sp.]